MSTHLETTTRPPTQRASAAPRVVPLETEQCVVLQGVSWATYARLLNDLADSHAAHFAYDRGVLEIMVLSAKHEELKDLLVLLVNVLAEEMNIDLRSFGSMTFRREDLERGFEPDACFYIQHVDRLAGKTSPDFRVDPPPDLIIEVDITSVSIDKLSIFAAFAVPEVWRYDDQALMIFRLEDGQYVEREESTALAGATGAQLASFIKDSQTMQRPIWLRQVREWVRQRQGRPR